MFVVASPGAIVAEVSVVTAPYSGSNSSNSSCNNSNNTRIYVDVADVFLFHRLLFPLPLPVQLRCFSAADAATFAAIVNR